MKITGVCTQLYKFEMDRPIGDADSPQGRKQNVSLAVFIDTAGAGPVYTRSARPSQKRWIWNKELFYA